MKISLPDDRDVGEAVGDSNEGMKEARDRYDARQKAIMDESMEDSLLRQNMISAGSDFKGRPQDEGYRPNAGTAMDRAMAEGAYDSGKITESGDQGFGGPGSSRTVKATPKVMPKAKSESKSEVKPTPKPSAKAEPTPTPISKATPAEKPASSSRVPTSEQAAANRSAAMDKIKGVGSSISDYFSGLKSPSQRKAQERKMEKLKADPTSRERDFAKGGKVSASSRGDGIAQRGKTRGKMC
jgi:hypothetical protein